MGQSINAIDLTILGSGTCVPSLTRSSCAVLIETGAKKLLFDSGAGTIRRLMQSGSSIFELDFIFYSHLHPDHTAELISILFSTKYPDGCGRQKPLHIVAAKGFKPFFDQLRRAYRHWLDLDPSLLRIIELDTAAPARLQQGDPLTGPDAPAAFSIRSTPGNHSPESLSYRIDSAGGSSVVYSGDTDFSEDLIALSRDTDLLICESAFPDEHKVPGHLTPSEAGTIATRAGARGLVLTHLYPQCDRADITGQCRQTYGGPLWIAADLMKLHIPANSGDNALLSG